MAKQTGDELDRGERNVDEQADNGDALGAEVGGLLWHERERTARRETMRLRWSEIAARRRPRRRRCGDRWRAAGLVWRRSCCQMRGC